MTHRLPADVSRCVNSQCAMRHRCLRWLCRLDNLRTSFACFDGDEQCQGYWPATEQPTTANAKDLARRALDSE